MLNLFQHLIKWAMKKSYVYILMNRNRTTNYIGVTNDLLRRVIEHKEGLGSIYTQKYNVKELVYYEEFSDINQAIDREKQLKNWHKEWKLNLIKTINPELKELEIV